MLQIFLLKQAALAIALGVGLGVGEGVGLGKSWYKAAIANSLAAYSLIIIIGLQGCHFCCLPFGLEL